MLKQRPERLSQRIRVQEREAGAPICYADVFIEVD